MAKLSELKKVQLLEDAVLDNDLELVQALFDEYAYIEFTARALGLACRFCGAEMVEVLAKNNVSFDFDITGPLVRKYDCRIDLSNQTGIERPYYLWTLPGYHVGGYNEKVISDADRAEVIRALKKNGLGDLKEMLYFAILYNDKASVTALESIGIHKLSPYRTSMVSGNKGYLQHFVWKAEREEYQFVLHNTNGKELLEILNAFLDHMGEDKIQLFQGDYNSYGHSYVEKYCSSSLFEFFVTKTNITDKYKKSALLKAVIKNDNKTGLEYALNNHWVNSDKELKSLLTYAKKNKASQEVLSCIEAEMTKDEYKTNVSQNTPVKKAKRDPVAAALRKNWGFRELDDGTLKITSYKGDSLEVVIPDTIGDKAVSVLGGDVFRLWPIRGNISDELREVRRNIVSLEIPGSIKEIPDYFYVSGGSTYALRKLIIHEGVRKIGEGAFRNCSNIEELSIPKSVKHIGEDAFRDCNTSQDDESIQLATVVEGLRYESEDGKIVITRINNIPDTGIIAIPEKINNEPVRTIRFKTASGEIFVSFGDGVPDYVDGEIEELHIPSTVEEIDTIPRVTRKICVDPANKHYWSDGIGLYDSDRARLLRVCVQGTEEYKVAEGTKEITEKAFFYVQESLKEISLPDSLEIIGEKVFSRCRRIKEIRIPKNVRDIRESALINSVTWIETKRNEPAHGFPALTAIKVDQENLTYADLDGVLFTKDYRQLIAFPTSKDVKKYKIPEQTKHVCNKAFYANQYLQELHVPANVVFDSNADKETFTGSQSLRRVVFESETVPEGAFRGSKKLEAVELSDDVKHIESYAFEDANIKTVELPKCLETLGWYTFGGSYGGSALRIVTVYDSIPCPDIGKLVSSWGFKNDYLMIVKDSGTGDIKSKVLMCGEGEPEKITEMLSHSWKAYAEFDYEQIDAHFKNYKDLWHRAQTARYRLEYPISLSDESRKMYTDFLGRNGMKIMTKLFDENKEEDVHCYGEMGALTKNNIDKITTLASEKKKTELVAWLLAYKNEHFKGARK